MFSKQPPLEEKPSVLPQLRQITQELVRGPHTKVYKTMGGLDTIVRNLMARNSIGVVDASIPEGETFPEHCHEEPIIEYLIVYEGRMSVLRTADGSVVERGVGEVCVITDEDRHIVEAMEGYGNVRFVAITIPKEPDFPGKVEDGRI